MSSIAVYSCFFGDPEPFNMDAMGDGEGYDRILFTDRADLKPEGIETRLVPSAALGPVHESRRAKLLPHQALPDYDWAIYVDNRATLTLHPEEVIARLGPSPAAGRYVWSHPERSSVYEELDICFLVGHLGTEEWREIETLYRSTALPAELTLTHNAVMLHKAGDEGTGRMSELWFELFLRYTKRDQLTMQLAEHLSGSPAIRMEGSLSEVAKWPVFLPQERAAATNPPHLNKPGHALSYSRLRHKLLRRRKKALIAKQRALR